MACHMAQPPSRRALHNSESTTSDETFFIWVPEVNESNPINAMPQIDSARLPSCFRTLTKLNDGLWLLSQQVWLTGPGMRDY